MLSCGQILSISTSSLKLLIDSIKTYRYIDDDYLSAKGAYVGLATPGDVGSWQRECKVTSKYINKIKHMF